MAQQNDVFQELQQTLESRAFELAYEKSCHQVEVVCKSERARQLRVQNLLLEDENGVLESQIARDDERMDSLERHSQETQEDLEACSAKLESAQCDLRLKSREIETLKAELNSLHGVTMDSTKLLTEKLTLARELSSLRPEIDHLRSQAASHQSLLAGKLALQRQLSTMQVELEIEKRSTQRAVAKEDKLQAEDAKMEARIETLLADLAKERRDRQKVERAAQKTSTESENRKTTLESRLDAFRNKLRTTKEQLKEMQAALEAAQATANAASSCSTTSVKPSVSLAKNSRKRASVQMDADTIIGTPGDMPAGKKNKRQSALVGEKSTFSITPFLNRTASVAPESPPLDNGGSDGEGEAKLADQVSRDSNAKQLSGEGRLVARNLKLTKGAEQAKKGVVLENAKSSKINSRPPLGRKPKAAPMLEQVAEEENIEDDGVAMPIPEGTNNEGLSDDTVNEGAKMKTKKKRKILTGGLGKTLFDEDEGDGVKGDGGFAGGVRGFGMLGRRALGSSNFGPRKALSSCRGTFGAISPRKGRRHASSSSSKRWQIRQGKDRFAINAKVKGLKSRAAFKLLEINEKYRIFHGGQTIVDLGYAPGSWSQVAVDRTLPNGRVLGIDIIPAQPPKGVSTIQGNFLSPAVQEEVKRFLRESDRGRTRKKVSLVAEDGEEQMTEEDLEQSSRSYIEVEKRAGDGRTDDRASAAPTTQRGGSAEDDGEGRMVDVVLSDMSEPWAQTEGFWKRSLSDPYYRMMNTSGMSFRDHAGSMDLATAALHFAFDTLRTGGHFVCKFYQGSEDKALESRLKHLFAKVHREKPESSRSESKESYFVALKRKGNVQGGDVFPSES